MTTANLIAHRTDALGAQVRETFEQVARNPYTQFHIHRGPYYARHYLGYDGSDLQSLPKVAIDRFVGLGNPFSVGELNAGETVLDLGCGAGSDALIAARRVGPEGRVIGIEPSAGMRACARMAVTAAGLSEWVQIRDGQFDALPVAAASIDLVIANGALQRTAERAWVFAEIRRVLKASGRLYLADLVVDREPSFDPDLGADLWQAFVAGALVEEELPELAARAGLVEGKLVSCYDCLRNAPLAERFAGRLRFHGVTFFAVK
ncbi:MAG: methyltransferase domain-containing protein [Bdellovibrio bacteriovorus]